MRLSGKVTEKKIGEFAQPGVFEAIDTISVSVRTRGTTHAIIIRWLGETIPLTPYEVRKLIPLLQKALEEVNKR